MSLNTIADEIGSMAKDEAKKVTSAAKKDAKAIQKEAQGQVDEYHADVMARADRAPIRARGKLMTITNGLRRAPRLAAITRYIRITPIPIDRKMS